MTDFTSTYLLYRRVDGGVGILRYRSLDSVAVISGTVDGVSVVGPGAYIFSANARQLEGGVWNGQEEAQTEGPEASGEWIREIHLSGGLMGTGAHAFYNCWNLEKLSLSSRTLDRGVGTLTGCIGMRYLDARVEEGERSYLKEMLAELRQTLFMDYHGKQGARLVFPEFFEESVGDMLARILEIHMRGCGHQYWYCFRQSGFQPLWYGSLSPDAQVQEDEELVIWLALRRLRFPYGLVEEHRATYWECLEAHRREAVVGTMKRKSMGELHWVTEQLAYDRGELAQMIATAGKLGDGAILSHLIDFRHKKFDDTREDGYETERSVERQRFELQKQRKQEVGG